MEDNFHTRKFIIQGLFILSALLLSYKAFELQVLDQSYQDKANSNLVQEITKYPSRGLIIDRNGKLLVNNDAMYDLMVTYRQVKPLDTLKFCKLLGISKDDFKKRLNKDWRSSRWSKNTPFAFLKKINADQYAGFQENLYQFPGFFTQLRNVRGYNTNVGAHVLGYISEVNRAQIESSDKVYQIGDYIGASGIELKYEKYLRGKKGTAIIVKDKFGREVGPYENRSYDTPAQSGKDLMTTLDIDLQAYAEYLMQNKRGSVVAIEPASGEILAFVSSPGYDPNQLAINRDRPKAFAHLLGDTLNPLFNRALMAQYPPGSIFKSTMSLVAMELGVLNANRGMTCYGAYNGKPRVGCHKHGATYNVASAIQYSCNNYYCHVFRDVVDKYGFRNAQEGLDTLVGHLHDFGLGKPLGIDLPNELPGNVPSSEYYNKIYPKDKGGWKSPTIISMGIGQGELLMTPLQMANMAAVIANRGHYYIPHLAKAFVDNETQIPLKYRTIHKVRIDSTHFEPVVDGMELVVTNGTAKVAQIPGKDITVCGKTGTSENPHGDDHSVFFCFAPKHNPKIAIAVYVENSGYGSRYAAPISSLIIEKYLSNTPLSPQRKAIEDRMAKANLLTDSRP